jgi:glyoxylase-like metal-dependent hydrolase (beta-lactamase superfamily II)
MTAARSRPDTSTSSQAQGRLPGGVKVTFLNAGTCRVPEVAVRPGGGFRLVDLPALAALIHHPTEGPVLFDTGYSPRFFAATERLPHRMYRWITPVTCGPHDTVAAQLPALGVTPQAVRQVVISHFDPDHIGGLRDFGAARIVCHAEAWESVRGRRGVDALRARVLPGHLPDDMVERVHEVTDFGSDSVAPLPGAHDLFGDGTVLLVGLPGHAPGHMGALIRRRTGGLWLLAADALWTRATLDRARPTAHALIAVDRRTQLATYTLLRQLHRERPDITIVPTHCPEAADELLPKSLHSWRPEQ